MRPVLLIPIALALPLAACNKQPEVSATNATPAEVQEKLAAATSADAPMVKPGRWEGAMTISEMDMPAMPAEAREKMKSHMGTARPFVTCLTEEEVKQRKAFFTGETPDKSCKYDHFNLSGGKLDAAMTCNREGGKMAMTMSGTYNADSYEMNMASRAEGGPMGVMNMKMKVAAKLVGACKGTKDEL